MNLNMKYNILSLNRRRKIAPLYSSEHQKFLSFFVKQSYQRLLVFSVGCFFGKVTWYLGSRCTLILCSVFGNDSQESQTLQSAVYVCTSNKVRYDLHQNYRVGFRENTEGARKKIVISCHCLWVICQQR